MLSLSVTCISAEICTVIKILLASSGSAKALCYCLPSPCRDMYSQNTNIESQTQSEVFLKVLTFCLCSITAAVV